MRCVRMVGWLALLIGVCCPVYAQSIDGLPQAIQSEVHAPLPHGRYEAAKSWSAAGREAAHQTGRVVMDSDASDGQAWEARVGSATPDDTLLYGPYVELPPSDYVAFFRVKLLDPAGEEDVATFDAAASYGQDILTTRDVTGSDLALNRYVEIPLPFHYPGGKLECRIAWRGYSSLRVDRVSLFRFEGGPLATQIPRAQPAVPSGKPSNLPYRPGPWRTTGLFPQSAPPAAHLLVFDLRHVTPDTQLMLLSLQGIVNRSRPRIYYLFNPTDAQWLSWMQKKGWTRKPVIVSRPAELLSRFRGSLRGMIITDPMLPATKNLATMLAGVEDGLVVSPRLAQGLSLPVLNDLRGRWHASVEVYRWAFDHLWPQLSHKVIACSYPDHLALRDYLVENRAFIFWISGPIDGARRYANPTAEARLMEQLLARMPANIPVMSYPWAGKDVGIGEGPGVTLFSEFGKYLVGSINCSNLSVHSGVRVPRFHRPAPSPVKLRPNRVYVSFVISDGDNLPVLTTSNFPQFWKDPVRGHIPLGWSISPSASLLIPDIVSYYYDTATPNDDFLGAVSGVGYTYPDFYGQRFRASERSRAFDGFLDQTRATMQRMGLTDLWIMNATRPSVIRRYAERIPFLQALFPDYGRRVSGYQDATYPTARNVPVFHAVTNWGEGMSREAQVQSVVAQVRAITPRDRPAFLHLFVLNWFADLPMLQEILHRLGPDYVTVRPDQLASLYRQWMQQTRLLVRAPAAVPAIEGQRLTFTADLQNVSSRPMTIRSAISGGIGHVTIEPAREHLLPGQSVSLTVSGTPAGPRVRLVVNDPFGTREHVLTVQAISAREIIGRLPVGEALRFVRQFSALELAHRSGQAEPDPGARQGQVWAARPGKTDAGYIAYGPYVSMPPGHYLALFRLKRVGAGQGPVVTLDTCVGGGVPETASRTLQAQDLSIGRFRSVPLVFTHPGGPLETRVLWTGNAAVVLDNVTLWKLPDGRATKAH